MATDYGALKDIVAIAGSLVAAGSAIAVSWTRRAKWMPPEETVPAATSRFSGLVCAVIVGVLYLLRLRIGQVPMLGVAGLSLTIALLALIVSIWVNTAHGFTYEGRRILGGFRLTDEATAVKVKRRWNEQQLLTNSNGHPDLAWTKGSIAAAQIVSTLGFIFLIAAGSIALASVAIAFSLSTSGTDAPATSSTASPTVATHPTAPSPVSQAATASQSVTVHVNHSEGPVIAVITGNATFGAPPNLPASAAK